MVLKLHSDGFCSVFILDNGFTYLSALTRIGSASKLALGKPKYAGGTRT